VNTADATASRTRGALNDWLRARVAGWAELGARIERLQRGERIGVAEAVEAAVDYRRIGRDLALAQQLSAPPSTTSFLARQYAGLHQALTRPVGRAWPDLFKLLRQTVPDAMRDMRARVFWVVMLLLGTATAGWLLVRLNPALVGLVASPRMIEYVENGRLWTDGLLNVVPPAVVSVEIFTNNIVVSLFACCLGVLYGLGTMYIIGMNGFVLGAVFAFTRQYGLDGRLFEFVIAHGIVELSVIVIAGAAGISLGEALIRPGRLTRRAAFERAVRQASAVMLVCLVFLVGAGLIEGFVSPNPTFPLAARAVIGTCYMVIFVAVLSGGALRRFKMPGDSRVVAAT
jgi:uncharacterized membrane protein SpoIIM required for sporulation